jgi:hypothetical protein
MLTRTPLCPRTQSAIMFKRLAASLGQVAGARHEVSASLPRMIRPSSIRSKPRSLSSTRWPTRASKAPAGRVLQSKRVASTASSPPRPRQSAGPLGAAPTPHPRYSRSRSASGDAGSQPHGADELHPVHVRHLEVQDNHVEGVLRKRGLGEGAETVLSLPRSRTLSRGTPDGRLSA